MYVSYKVTIRKYEITEITIEKSFDNEKSARRYFLQECKKLPGSLVYKQKGDGLRDTLIEKRTYRYMYNAASIKMSRGLLYS